jgi:hypothetical protein
MTGDGDTGGHASYFEDIFGLLLGHFETHSLLLRWEGRLGGEPPGDLPVCYLWSFAVIDFCY